MSERIEKIIREYPVMKRELKLLSYQIADFRGVSEQDVIESLLFGQPEGERVQTSNIANKTENIALSYKKHLEQINAEWYDYLGKKYITLAEEVRFLEGAIRSLPDKMGEIMTALVIENMTWDAAAEALFVNRRTVGKLRVKAIEELEKIYADHEAEEIEFLLS